MQQIEDVHHKHTHTHTHTHTHKREERVRASLVISPDLPPLLFPLFFFFRQSCHMQSSSIVTIGGQAASPVSRTQTTSTKAWFIWSFWSIFCACSFREFGSFEIQSIGLIIGRIRILGRAKIKLQGHRGDYQALKTVIRLSDSCTWKSVGANNICSCLQIFLHIWIKWGN